MNNSLLERKTPSFGSLLIAFVLLSMPLGRAGDSQPQERSFQVTVDPRVEVLAVAQYLTDYCSLAPQLGGRINNFEHPYIRGMKSHFEQYRGNQVLARFGALRVIGSEPFSIAVQLSAPNALSLPSTLERVESPRDKVEAFAGTLREFAGQAEFMAYFEKTKEAREKIVADFESMVDTRSLTTRLESYCGLAAGHYVVILAPLLGRTSFGPSAKAADGSSIFYVVFPVQRVDENGRLVFGEPARVRAYLSHEFGHSFTNPIVDRHWTELSRFSDLMQRVKYPKSSNYGRNWRVFLYESFLRAMVARLVLQEKGREAYREQMENDLRGGFVFQEELCRALEVYEGNRARYASLEAFLPEWLHVFEKLSATPSAPDLAQR